MSNEFERLGPLRSAIVVAVAATAAVTALSLSGLSVAVSNHAVATITPRAQAPAVTVAPTRRASAHRSRAVAAAPRLKHCQPVDGVEFTVSADRPCPKPLKNAGRGPHLSAQLRRAANRPRPGPTATTAGKPPLARATTSTTAQTQAQGKPTAPQPKNSSTKKPASKTSQTGGVEGPPTNKK